MTARTHTHSDTNQMRQTDTLDTLDQTAHVKMCIWFPVREHTHTPASVLTLSNRLADVMIIVFPCEIVCKSRYRGAEKCTRDCARDEFRDLCAYLRVPLNPLNDILIVDELSG